MPYYWLEAKKKKKKKELTFLNSYQNTSADNWKCLLSQGSWQAASWSLLQYEMLLRHAEVPVATHQIPLEVSAHTT